MTNQEDKANPSVGDYLIPDGKPNKIGKLLLEGSDYVDSGFHGCQFRHPVLQGLYELAINIKVTGKKHWVGGHGSGNVYKSRVKIEWVGDCEESTFSGGWIYTA